MKKKFALVILTIAFIVVIFIGYRQLFYKTKFKVEYFDKSYDVALITSSYDALSENLNTYNYNELYLLTGDDILNKRILPDTWPTSNNLAVVNDEIIFKNFSDVVDYTEYLKSDSELVAEPYFANYADKYITSNNKVIFNEQNVLQLYDPVKKSVTAYPTSEEVHKIIGFDESKQEVKTIYEDVDGQLYYSNVSTNGETITPLVELIPQIDNTYEIIGGIENGNKIITNKYADRNQVDNLYPFQVWNLSTGQLEKEIQPNISTKSTEADTFPEVAICGDNCIVSLTRNGYIYQTNIETGKTINYDISHLKLQTDETTTIQYVEDDDTLYLINQPLNDNKYLEIYDVTNDKVVLKVELNRFEQFYSGFTVNKPN